MQTPIKTEQIHSDIAVVRVIYIKQNKISYAFNFFTFHCFSVINLMLIYEICEDFEILNNREMSM